MKWNADGVYRSKNIQSHGLKDVRRWQIRVFRWFPGRGVLCCTTWTGRDSDVRLGQCVNYMVTSHATALPSGRLPPSLSLWADRWFLADWTSASHRGRQTRSLTSRWRAILPKAKRVTHERAWVPLAPVVFPQEQSWGVRRLPQVSRPTVILL